MSVYDEVYRAFESWYNEKRRKIYPDVRKAARAFLKDFHYNCEDAIAHRLYVVGAIDDDYI